MELVKILLCAVLVCQMALGVLSTANPKATPQAKRLLQALSNVGGKILSGAFGGWKGSKDAVEFSMNELNGIRKGSTKAPAVYALECSPGWLMTAPGRETDIVECFDKDFAAYGKQGGILTISHLLPNPVYPGNRVDGKLATNKILTNQQYASILKNGTPERARWLALLTKVAAGLKKYQDMGLPILYRPFREQNGQWFWWGSIDGDMWNKERFQLFRLLQIDLFNFMNSHGVNNLLYVYCLGGRDVKPGFYPGKQYVDVVTLDWYTDNYTDLEGYNEMIALGKPFGFAEVGPMKNYGNFDYDKFVNVLLTKYPKTSYYLSWNYEYSPLRNKGVWGAYNNPRVINLGQFKY